MVKGKRLLGRRDDVGAAWDFLIELGKEDSGERDVGRKPEKRRRTGKGKGKGKGAAGIQGG